MSAQEQQQATPNNVVKLDINQKNKANDKKYNSKKQARNAFNMDRRYPSIQGKGYLEHVIHLVSDKEYTFEAQNADGTVNVFDKAKFNRAMLKYIVDYDKAHGTNNYTLVFNIVINDIVAKFKAIAQAIAQKYKGEVEIYYMIHNKDTISKDAFELAIDKPHIHFIWHDLSGKERRASTIMNALGFVFIKELDESLVRKRGVEETKNYPSSVVYLTHETKQAKADGKYIYDKSEIITAVSAERIEELHREYYADATKNPYEIDEYTGMTPVEEWGQKFYQLGTRYEDFEEYYLYKFKIDEQYKMQSNVRNYMYMYYKQGQKDQIAKSLTLHRRSIFIQGPKHCGKTFTATAAMHYLFGDKNTLVIKGGGTGKYDNLKGHHKAIILDDNTTDELLALADEYPCFAYKRNSNNPVWNGEYFIVTYNKSIIDYINDCGGYEINTNYVTNPLNPMESIYAGKYKELQPAQTQAVISRFSVIKVDDDKEYLRDALERPILFDFEQSYDATTGAIRVKAVIYKYYRYRLEYYQERAHANTKPGKYRNGEVDKFVNAMNGMSVRNPNTIECIEIDENHELLSKHIKGNKIDLSSFAVNICNFDDYIAQYMPVKQEILDDIYNRTEEVVIPENAKSL